MNQAGPASRPRWLLPTALAGMFLAGGIGRLALGPALTAWDQQLLERVATYRTEALTGIMGVLSAIGEGTIALPLALLLGWILYRRGDRLAAKCYLLTCTTGWALNILLKLAFRRPRPAILPHLDVAGGYSYPSGHAMLAPLVFGLGALLLARPLPPAPRALLVAAGAGLSIAIALSRIYLAVHYPSDITGALLAGTAWASVGLAVYHPLDRAGESGSGLPT